MMGLHFVQLTMDRRRPELIALWLISGNNGFTTSNLDHVKSECQNMCKVLEMSFPIHNRPEKCLEFLLLILLKFEKVKIREILMFGPPLRLFRRSNRFPGFIWDGVRALSTKHQAFETTLVITGHSWDHSLRFMTIIYQKFVLCELL